MIVWPGDARSNLTTERLSLEKPGNQGHLGYGGIILKGFPMTENKISVLVVDNNPVLLRENSVILENAGYRVIKANSGLECLEKIAVEPPDLVLLDLDLPDISGLESL